MENEGTGSTDPLSSRKWGRIECCQSSKQLYSLPKKYLKRPAHAACQQEQIIRKITLFGIGVRVENGR